MCSAALGGEILISDPMRQRLTRTHELTDHAPLEFPSRQDPLPVFRVIK